MKTTLVTCTDVAAHPEWRLVDCRHDLAQPEAGRAQFLQGHLPRAVHAHLDHDLSGPRTGHNGRHPLPSPGQFQCWLEQQGIRPTDQVVAYDANNGMFAARLWWMLRWVGHPAVAVLDGGLAAWLRQGFELDRHPTHWPMSQHPVQPQPHGQVDADWVHAHLHAPQHLLLDARAADRFAGRNETLDPVAGHIPGAINRPFALNLDEHGGFLPPDLLRQAFHALLDGRPPQNLVVQCGSGVTACHHLLALEIAGLPGARLYPGSWSEWCSDPQRPVVTT